MKFSEAAAKQKALEGEIAKHRAALEAARWDLEALYNAEVVPLVEARPETKPPEEEEEAAAEATQPEAAPKQRKQRKKQGKKSAGESRKAAARGDRPPLRKAMILVVGDEAMNAAQIVAALDAKGWLPLSKDPRQYVSYMLSSNTPEVFERTEDRGFYRLRPDYDPEKKTSGKGGNGGPKKGKALKKTAPKARKSTSSDVDEKISEIYGSDMVHNNVDADPFESSSVADTV